MALPKIQHPLVDVQIPSLKKIVKIRPYLVKEEKILLFAKQSGENKDILNAIKQVVSNCIIDKIDVDKLAVFDLEYLFLKLRALSVNNVAKLTWQDEGDEKTHNFEINLDQVEIKFPKKDNRMIEINEQYSLLMKYPDASIYAEEEPTDPGESLNYYLDKTISKIIEGDQMVDWSMATKEEKTSFIDDLPAKTLESVKDFWNNMPKLDHVIKYTNKEGKEKELKLTKLADFFTL